MNKKYHIIISIKNKKPIDLIANNELTKNLIEDLYYDKVFSKDCFAISIVEINYKT